MGVTFKGWFSRVIINLVCKKNLNFKSIILQAFLLFIIIFVTLFKYTFDIEYLLENIQYKYLIVLNIISIFLGLPYLFYLTLY